MMEKRRQNIRLSKELYENPQQIFSFTICTHKRRTHFINRLWTNTILGSLNTGPINKETDRYAWCLMPDHLHLLISPSEGNLIQTIGRWKSFTGHLLRKIGLNEPCWQRGFFDHALRKEEDIQRAADYIVNNPVRKGLVDNWRDYPYSWHKWM
jgi:putative transposase